MKPTDAAITALALVAIQTAIILRLVPFKRRGRLILLTCSGLLCAGLIAILLQH
ncbi:hypothetical protein [Lacticaseibacillus daqingensis]|uniref:hypothetical protein n=1 Tax=Lacticaseibacillus daqingensis TaxID=2486014 RepID=UPI0013DE6DBC|nr:hypothetical protein [Lacticaseibacillus daqingensis]